MKQLNRLRKTPSGLKIKRGFILVFILKIFLYRDIKYLRDARYINKN